MHRNLRPYVCPYLLHLLQDDYPHFTADICLLSCLLYGIFWSKWAIWGESISYKHNVTDVLIDYAVQRSSFATPARAILKTMTMTTGEFEYDSIFRQFPGGAEDGSIETEIPFPPVSFILWIIFLILMPILLTNLLVRYNNYVVVPATN